MPRKKVLNVRIPYSTAEVSEFISRLRDAKRAIEKKTLTANARIAKIQAELVAETTPIQQELDDLAAGLQAYATAHRFELTDGGKVQSTEFGTGRLGWRMTPPRVELRGLDKVIDWLRREGLKAFLRIKWEVNKEAMLADPERAETVPGVSIVQEEVFYVWPQEFDEEVVIAKSKLKRKAA
jgi:phage host-nuclease inhibitor protein Gam